MQRFFRRDCDFVAKSGYQRFQCRILSFDCVQLADQFRDGLF